MTTDSRDELLALLLEEGGFEPPQEAAETVAHRIPRLPAGQPPPLSFAQQRLWFLDRLAPGDPAYNVAAAVRLRGRLEIAALDGALREIARRHRALRTVVPSPRGRPEPAELPPGDFGLARVDLTALPAAGDRRLDEQFVAAALEPFDLGRGPLVRALLARLGDDDHALLLAVHHIVADGWSIGVLTRELTELYPALAAGRPSPLPEPTLDYGDFAAWQRERLTGETLDRLLAFWRHRLGGELPVLELPTDRPRPPLESHRGARHRFHVPAAAARRLEQLGRRRGTTLFAVLLAAWDALLAAYTGQRDLVVGTPVAGRDLPELEGLIGLFVNTLPIRADLGGDPPFEELVRRVGGAVVEALAHQELPLERMVEELQPERSLGRSPLFQVMFTLQNAPAGLPDLPGVGLERMELALPTARFDLTLEIEPRPDGLAGALDYRSDLWEPATVERMADALGALLAAVAEDPGLPLSRLPRMGAAERRRLLAGWNDTARPLPDRCLHRLIEERVDATPEAVAVSCGGETLSYAALDAAANRLAHRLRREGAGRGARVAIFLDRSPAVPVALLAVLKSGAAYLPLDPEQPADRIAFLLADAAPRLVVTTRELAAELPPGGPPQLALDAEEAALAAESAERPAAGRVPGDPAYVLYTSGSTGRPKGVVIADRSLVNFLAAMGERPGLGPGDTLLAVTTVSFDISGLELYLPLLAGGRVAIAPRGAAADGRELARLVASTGATAMQATPTGWRLLLDAGPPPAPPGAAPLKALCGGEALPAELAGRMTAAGLEVWNLYGPTETTIWSTAARLGPGEPVTIGRPIANTRLYVVDRGLDPVPQGAEGELCIGGSGVAVGYHDRPALTAERFVPDPFGEQAGARLYRTGDRVRYLADGRLAFRGRLDHQVKVRGFRIEPGEIETVLGSLPGVEQAAVVARRGGDGETRLVAFFVAEPDAALTPAGLRSALAERLPDYMLPAALVPLERMPLTPNRKIDRKALPETGTGGRSAGADYVAPRNLLEGMLAGIWAELLGVDRVGVRDDFFELGGHSLLATRALARVAETLGVEVPVARLFAAPTVAALATEVERARREARRPAAPPLGPVPRDGDPPLSFAQQRLWFVDRLYPGSVAFLQATALRLDGPLDPGALRRAFAGVVSRHEVLRTRFIDHEGVPAQRIEDDPRLTWIETDLRPLPEPARQPEARRLARALADRPFDLAADPLLRVLLIRLGERRWVAAMTVHHIVFDAWSLGVLTREVAVLYAATADEAEPAPPLPAPPLQYADFALWQRRWLSGDTLAAELDYWRGRLTDAPRDLELPIERPRPAGAPAGGGRRGRLLRFELPAATREALHALGRRQGSTLFITLLAAFSALLYRYTGRRRIVVGSPVANRGRAELEGMIGLLVNTVVLATDLDGDPEVGELLARVRETVVGAADHAELPLEKLVEALRPPRVPGRANPLFPITFGVATAGEAGVALDLPGIETGLFPVELEVEVDLINLFLTDTGDAVEGTLAYNAARFEPTAVRRLAGHLGALAAAMAEDPGRRISALPLVSRAERAQLLGEWGGGAVPYPRDAGLADLFAAQVERTPEACAVDLGGERLSFRELGRRAHGLAHELRRRGVGRGTAVGLCCDRGTAMAVSVVAILEAGGAYLPLDPAYPAGRLAQMLADTGAPVVVVEPHLVDLLPAGLGGDRLVYTPGRVAPAPEPPPKLAGGGDPAYVIFTSGSTGRPKGVVVPQRAVARLVLDTDYVQLGPDDRVGQASNISFDAATFEIWGALLTGARLVGVPREVALSPPALAAHLRSTGITALFLTTSLFNQVARRRPDAFATLRHLMVGGEALDPEAMRRVLDAGPPERLLNVYGPTECTTFATWHRIERVAAGAASIPIGLPIANTRAVVVDRGMQLVPAGLAGELLLGGDGLADGYAGRPGLTAERFVPDPFATAPGTPLYRTGDLCRRRGDGAIEFLGRIDHQVKIRGFRVEPGEIEAALGCHPAVAEAAVVARDAEGGAKRLVAYLVPAGEAPTAGELRRFLAGELAEFMVPSAFVVLDRMPLTPNGKLDRSALPAPEARPELDTAFVAAEGGLEERLSGVWAAVLGLDRVGVHDDWFELGGDSVLAIELVDRARREGIGLRVHQLFANPSVAALAAAVRDEAPEPAAVAGPAAEPAAGPLRMPLTPIQQGMLFHTLYHPDDDQYLVQMGFELEGALDPELIERAWRHLADRHPVLGAGCDWEGGGEPELVVAGELSEPPLARHDWSALPAGEAERRLASWLLDQRRRVRFALDRPPLYRLDLFRFAPKRHRLVLTCHHLLLDGWSIFLLVSELAAVYAALDRGERPELPPAPRFAAFAARLADRETAAAEAFWRRRLAGFAAPVPLAADRPRSDGAAGGYGAVRRPLPDGLVERLAALARRHRVTPGAVALGGWALLLARHGGRRDVVFGNTVSGRASGGAGDQGMVGLLLNTLPVRATADPGAEVGPWLETLHRGHLEALRHEHTPLADVQRWSGVPAGMPLFESLVVVQNLPVEALFAGSRGGALEVRHTDSLDKTNYPVTVLLETGGRPALELLYHPDRIDRTTALRMLGHYRALLEGLAAGGGRRLGELAMLSPAERHQLVVEWNDTAARYGWQPPLHRLIAEQARRTPDAVAVELDEAALSYGELARRAVALARRLRRAGAGPGRLVGVAMERSPELLVALVAVLEAGAAYVPLDPDYPAERLRFLFADAAMPVLLTQRRLLDRLPDTAARVIAVDDPAPARAAPGGDDGEDLAALPEVDPDELAYAIYTSGSTGRPKSAGNSHRAICNRLAWMQSAYRLGPGDRVLQKTPTSFDVSVWELFWPLLTGARMVLARPGGHRDSAYLARTVAERGITTLHFVPSMLSPFLDEPGLGRCTALRRVIASGEALPPALVERFYDRLGSTGATLHNLYGPTEAAVDVTAWRCPPDGGRGVVPIGRPIGNLRIHLLDRDLGPVPIGVAGELYIGGVGLARGYVRRPGLTAGRFVPDPVGPTPGARLYRTGDLARHLPGGEIEYLGRVDFQVKVRGLRIELGEIEAALDAHPELRDAVVVARPGAGGDPRLIAYVVAAGEGRPSPGELRRHLEERIPAFMVPAVFVALDALPLTPNGKLDRKALPEPPAERPELAAGFVAPATAAERLLAAVWQEVLELDRVGVEDRFVDLGGDSILALRVVARARAAGLSLGVRELFERPTIRQLAASVELAGTDQPPAGPAQPPAEPTPALGLTAGQRRFVERHGRDLEDAYPLSPLQQGMLFDALYEPEAGRYVSQLAVEAGAGLDPELFRAAWEHVAARHPALRTSLRWEGLDAPLQLVHRRAEVRSEVDADGLAGDDRDRRLDGLLAADRRRGFDLGSAPLLRNALLRDGDGWVWLWSFHHLVLDGWSVARVLDELFTAYRALGRGEAPALGPAPPFADFIAALGGRDRAAEEGYWRRLLAGFTAPTRLGIDRGEAAGERPPEVYEQRRLRLGAELAAALRELARGAGLTVNLVLQGAWALLLGRYSGEREVVFGTAVSGRPPELPGVEAMVGLLINALPVRVELPGEVPLGEWLGDLQAQQHDSLRYELTSLADLQRWSELPRGVPLFETFFAFQAEGAEEVLERVGGDLGLRQLRALGMSSHPLTLSASGAGEIALTLTFDPRRFAGEAVDRLAVHLRNLLAAMAEGGPLQPLDELSMLTAEELRREAAGGAGDGRGTAAAPPPPEAVDELSDSEVDALLAELLDTEEPS